MPDTVIVLGTGVERGRLVKLGHWWDAQWQVGDTPRGEVLIAGEALHLPPECVFEILLHEAAHGLSAARGIKDTSRGGRYHNANFKAAAAELGLRPRRMDPYGWARTELTDTVRDRYADVIGEIEQHMVLARGLSVRPVAGVERQGGGEPAGPDAIGSAGERKGPKNPAAECGCGRKMRMAKSVFAQGPVLCGVCGSEFTAPLAAERLEAETVPAGAVVDDSFIGRRERAIAEQGPEPDHLAAGLERLRQIGAAIDAVATSSDDPEAKLMQQVFADRKGEIITWLEALVTAEVIELPGRDASPAADVTAGPDARPPEAARAGEQAMVGPPPELDPPVPLVEPPLPEP